MSAVRITEEKEEVNVSTVDKAVESETKKVDITERKRKREDNNQTMNCVMDSAPSANPSKVQVIENADNVESNRLKPVKKMKCPPGLFRSRDFLFRGITLAQRRNIVMDTVASFSVTESQMADRMTSKILQFAEKVKPNDNVIFDGMACVGGNTISFAQSFKTVFANEYDHSRFNMLRHNVTDVLNIQNVTYFNGSIIDLAMTCEYDVLFLDPEWGGPDYKFKKQLRLTISDVSVEDLCVKVMRDCVRVHTIALKLPVNYDNSYLQQVAESHGLSYSMFTNYQKMTLTILQKKV